MDFTQTLDDRQDRLQWSWLASGITVFGACLAAWVLGHSLVRWPGWHSILIMFLALAPWLIGGSLMLVHNVMSLRRPRVLEVDPTGVTLRDWRRVRRIAWADIQQITLSTFTTGLFGFTTVPRVTVIGTDGKMSWNMKFSHEPSKFTINQLPLALALKLRDAAMAAGYKVPLDTAAYQAPIPQIQLQSPQKPDGLVVRIIVFGLLACAIGLWLLVEFWM